MKSTPLTTDVGLVTDGSSVVFAAGRYPT